MWPMKILRLTVLAQVLLLVLCLGYANGIPPSHTRTSRQIIPLAQGTFNNILQSMSEGAKAVRLVVSRPFQQLRNSIPRFPFGGGSSTTTRPKQSRPQKQTLDLSEVHYHYDDFGNRIENPQEYLKQFKNSVSHSHSHFGEATGLPDNVLKELEYKEEARFEKDVDAGTAFSSSFDYSPSTFKSNFKNQQFNTFGGFETSSTTTHNDDWAPVAKSKPASSLHTQVAGISNFNNNKGSENLFGSSSKFFNSRPVTTYRSVKHYDSDRPSSSYSFHHFASPDVDYGVDTKPKDSSTFGSSLLGSSSMKVSKTQNFDQFFDYYDKKNKDHHVSESQVQAVAEKLVMEKENKPQAPVQKPETTTTTTTQKPITTTRSRPTGNSNRNAPRAGPSQKTRGGDREQKHSHATAKSNGERPNYPEYFFSNVKDTPKPKFIPVRNVRDEEELFKGSFTPPAKFIPQAPKFTAPQTKEPLHIVMAQSEKHVPRVSEKPRKHEANTDKKSFSTSPFSMRKRYPTTRLPVRFENTTPFVNSPSPVPTSSAAAHVTSFTEGYSQNEVASAESERKYPKKYMVPETTTTTVKPTIRARPAQHETTSRPAGRGAGRPRGSVRFGARL